MARRSFRLAAALPVLLLFMLPMMVLIGATEGRFARPGILFWLLVMLPFLTLPWLLRCCDAEETADGHRVAASRLEPKGDPVSAGRLPDLVSSTIDVKRTYVQQGVPAAEGALRLGSRQAFAELERRFRPHGLMPLLESIGGNMVRVLALPDGLDDRLRRRSSVAVNALLFLATVVTTIYAGALHRGVNLLDEPGLFLAGLPYAIALLAILGVHEMGHYVTARRHGVDVSLPYFIPVPMGLGTFGAFIQMKSLMKSRRAVFDIGIAGPLAGLVIALPALYFGLRGSEALGEAGPTAGIQTGSSLLLALMYQAANGGDLGVAAVRLTPIAFAGWVGLFVTALNLLPVGQLDGGHIAYGLFGRRHARRISVGAVVLMLALGFFVWPGLLTWALLVTLLAGFSHLPALDDVTAPDAKRFALGALALVILLLIIMPVPGVLQPNLDSPYQ